MQKELSPKIMGLPDHLPNSRQECQKKFQRVAWMPRGGSPCRKNWGDLDTWTWTRRNLRGKGQWICANGTTNAVLVPILLFLLIRLSSIPSQKIKIMTHYPCQNSINPYIIKSTSAKLNTRAQVVESADSTTNMCNVLGMYTFPN